MEIVDEHVRARPAPELRGLVGDYVGYRQRDVAPKLHRGLPSPYLTLIFTMDEPLHIVRHVDPRRAPARYTALLAGLHTSPAYVGHGGAQSGVQVRISPLGARRLLGVPAGELVGVDSAAEALLGGVIEQVREGLINATGWPARFEAVDRALRGLLRDAPVVADEVRCAWLRLQDTGGRAGVAKLAGEIGWSERHLATRFRQEIGLTPKTAARVIRFDRARHRLQRLAGGDLASVAADFGYVDQSHMSRDFLEMAGCPPGRWWVEEFGNVQSRPVPCGASLTS